MKKHTMSALHLLADPAWQYLSSGGWDKAFCMSAAIWWFLLCAVVAAGTTVSTATLLLTMHQNAKQHVCAEPESIVSVPNLRRLCDQLSKWFHDL
jgi:hypothetical protein